MLGFVPQPNLQKASVYHELIFSVETQQIGEASFRPTTIFIIQYDSAAPEGDPPTYQRRHHIQQFP